MLEHDAADSFYTHVSVSTLIKDPVCQNQILYSHKNPPKFSDVVKSSDTFSFWEEGEKWEGNGGCR